jgi:hypothetical protein
MTFSRKKGIGPQSQSLKAEIAKFYRSLLTLEYSGSYQGWMTLDRCIPCNKEGKEQDYKLIF